MNATKNSKVASKNRLALIFAAPALVIGVSHYSEAADIRTCEGVLSGATVATQFGFNPNPTVQAETGQIVAKSELRPKPNTTKGFNNGIQNPDANNLSKVVRQEAPFTIKSIGQWLDRVSAKLNKFMDLGFVAGDPHSGNVGIEPSVFIDGGRDHNLYTLTDLDEVSVGVMSMDFARYVIFLKAQYGDLSKTFGPDFQQNLFDAYKKGLHQVKLDPPTFVSKVLNADANSIRAKIQKYAKTRTDEQGHFQSKYFDDHELLEFKIKDIKPEFLKTAGFEAEKTSKHDFKAALVKDMETALQSKFSGEIHVLDVALPPHDSGGSAEMQRFLVSTEIKFEGQAYRLLVEFKENQSRAGWEEVVESPIQNANDRYALALRTSNDQPGPFLRVVQVGKTGFLMRPKGGMNMKVKSLEDTRDQMIFNANAFGLYHGGQGPTVSAPYAAEVDANYSEFQTVIMEVSDKIVMKLQNLSGTKPAKNHLSK